MLTLASIGAILLFSGCEITRGRVRSTGDEMAQVPVQTVPIATVLNEIKCDYLDFAYSDYARQRRLAVGKVTGTLRLSVSQDGTRVGSFAVPVASDTLRTGRSVDAPRVASQLSVPFALDPKLALDPGNAGFDCGPGARLAKPIWDVTALAATIAPMQGGDPQLQLRSPLAWQGQFYLVRRGNGVEAVPVTVDPRRAGAAAVYLQSFEATIETGVASWFADVGAATSEPRGTPDTGYDAPINRPSRVRVPTAPRAARQHKQVTRPPSIVRVHRCTPDASGELLCY